MGHDGELIFVGAEAEVRRSTFLGLQSVRKTRRPKAYRHPDLDARIRRERVRTEAQLLGDAARSGIPVPRVLDADVAQAVLELEAIPGKPLRVHLEEGHAHGAVWCREFGSIVGRLHAAGLIHGDLTTSNVIVRNEHLVLLDFGLAQRSAELEDRGVDLHLVERTFEASHPDHAELFDAFRAGYSDAFTDAWTVLERMEEIRARGRYV